MLDSDKAGCGNGYISDGYQWWYRVISCKNTYVRKNLKKNLVFSMSRFSVRDHLTHDIFKSFIKMATKMYTQK